MPEDIKEPTPEVVDDKTPPVVDDTKPEETKETTIPDDKTDKTDEEKKEPIKEEEEVKEPEKKEEPEKKDEDVDVAGLKAEIAKLQGQLEQALSQNKDDSKIALDQANTLLKVQKDLASSYEGILNGIIEAKLQEIPENLRELVPANLSLGEKMDWLTKAEKSGVFKASNPDVEIGKPLNPNNVKQTTDTSKLSASAIMSMAYGNSKGKGKK